MKIASLLAGLMVALAVFTMVETSAKAEPVDSVKWYPVPLPPAPATKPTAILLPASRDYNLPSGLPARKLFTNSTRDPHILTAPDGYYYMVATAFANTLPEPLKSRPDANAWWYNDGIPLWRSKDLIHWESMGYVWTLEKDATWAREYKLSPHTQRPDGGKLRAVWAPEIHYMKGTYWMVYCMNYDGTGLLKSTSGKPEGPYVDMKPGGPISDGIDASIFEDTDGSVYFFDRGYHIARMKPDMSDIAEPMHDLNFVPKPPWGEGINMKKINGRYVWTNAGNATAKWHGKDTRTYDCYSATSDSLMGPYTNRYRAIPTAGHNDLFQDRQGHWWSTFFGTDPIAPFTIQPGVVPITIDQNGHIEPKRSYPRPLWQYTDAAPPGDWTSAKFNDSTWKKGEAGFGDPLIQESGPVTDVGTEWKAGELWLRKKFTLDPLPVGPQLFLRHSGAVQVSINGHEVYAATDPTDDYVTAPLPEAALQKGENTISVHAGSGAGPQYFDLGLVDKREKIIVPTAKEMQAPWRYTAEPPAETWMKAGFDDAAWKSGHAGFGSAGMGGTVIGTEWTGSDIWLRRAFTVSDPPTSPTLRIYHDEDAEVYINGVLALTAAGFNATYEDVKMTPAGAAALRAGQNVLAIHCHQTGGGQYIDAGIVELP